MFVDCGLRDAPCVIQLAATHGIARAEALGIVVGLHAWSHAHGCADFAEGEVAEACGWSGDSADLADTLALCGILERKDDETYRLAPCGLITPEIDEYAGVARNG